MGLFLPSLIYSEIKIVNIVLVIIERGPSILTDNDSMELITILEITLEI